MNKPTYEELLHKNKELELKLNHQNSESTKQLFELSIDMLSIADFDGYFKLINPAFENTLGYFEGELTKHPYYYFIHPDDMDSTKATINQLSSGHSILNFKNRFRCKDGSYKWLHWTSKPVISENLTYSIARDITEQKQMLENLHESHSYLESIFRAVPTGIGLVKDRILKEVNNTVCQMTGYAREELIEQNSRILYLNDEEYEYVGREKYRQIQDKGTGTVETRFKCKDGELIDVLLSSTPLDINDYSKGVTFTVLDITEQKRKDQQIKEKNQFIQTVIDGVNDAIMVINTDYSVSLMNHSAIELMNKDFISDINSPKCYEISHHQKIPCSGLEHPCPLKQVLQDGNVTSCIHQHENKKGEIRQVELTATPLKDNTDKVYAIIESSHDITDLLQIQKKLHERSLELAHKAHHDELTKLPNRLLFVDRLRQAIKQAQRNHEKVAVLFIDLDHFKEINDSLGHPVGDDVLKEVSMRLQSCIRQVDSVARLGGDEFIILLNGIKDSNVVIEIALQILKKLSLAINHEIQHLYVTSSIGISLYPDDGPNEEVLIRNADSAMYKAKEEGRNTYRYYTEDMTEKAFEHILMESNLRHALKNNELVVYYQPQVNAKTHQIIGMEALVRWQHPELGIISPAKFIPLAEKTGLIVPLGEQVLQIATKQMGIWMKGFEGNCRLAINLSVKQLVYDGIVETIATILKENQCQAEWIELEVTEGYLMTNPEQAIKTLHQLKQMGFTVSIDDFGTGYSSLSYLKRLPISKLKIDRSFVRDITTNEDDRAIVIAVISLAQAMKLNVIAEGVETHQQKDFLQENGCEAIQGYLYSRPLPEKDMTELLKSKKIEL